MEEFLKSNYRFILHSVEFLAAMIGVICLRKYKSNSAKYFISFLVYLIVCDFLGGYTWYVQPNKLLDFLKGSVFEKNFWWSTLFWKIGAILFFAFFYHKILRLKSFKKIIKYGGLTFFLFSISYIGINFEDYFTRFFPIISILGAIIIFLCSVFYFIEILCSDKILTFYKSLNFYISIAIFIWWLITTPIVFYDAYFTYEVGNLNRDWNFIFLKWEIYLFANIFMYSTFIFALLWCKPEND